LIVTIPSYAYILTKSTYNHMPKSTHTHLNPHTYTIAVDL